MERTLRWTGMLIVVLPCLAWGRDGLIWEHLSSTTGDLPIPNGSNQQTTCVVADVVGDGAEDIFITDRSTIPSVILYRRSGSAWDTYVLDADWLSIEAGGAAGDVDGDGDLDLALGQDSSGGMVWWWENPLPDLDPETPWRRRLVKTGGRQQHDQSFGDFDGDGSIEFATWVNQSGRIEIYEIPSDPLRVSPWTRVASFDASGEGMDVLDVDGDGKEDLCAGGSWIRHDEGSQYTRDWIDSGYTSSRITGGDFIPGGWTEIVLNSGDGRGPLNFYHHDGSSWRKTTLIPDVNHGHSLEVDDIDGDGHLDIFAAEMGSPGAGSNATAWIAWGDGTGAFELEVITRGIGNHMSRLADLDGDGDIDIVMKPYSFGAPRVDVLLNNGTSARRFALDQWQRHLIDTMPNRAVFIEAGDLDGDGHRDLVAGAWWWRNPGLLAGSWSRFPLGPGFNTGALVGDFDSDGDLDLLGTAGVGSASNNDLRWAENDGSGLFTVHPTIATGGTGDFLQGRVIAPFQNGLTQIALSWHNGGGGVHVLTVPVDPVTDQWEFSTLSPITQGEDLSEGDVDGDGDRDLVLGTVWLENRGTVWMPHELGTLADLGGSPEPDRNDLADVDGDGDLDVVIGLENGTQILWFENPRPAGSVTAHWPRLDIGDVAGQGFSMDTEDMDGDGDPDVVVGEHRGSQNNRVIVFENTGGRSEWPFHVIDIQPATVCDHHDGTQLIDMDGDGDLDIISTGWDNPKVWLYENTTPHQGIPAVSRPAVRPNGGTFIGSVTVSLACATGSAQLYYTLDGTVPTEASAPYDGPFLLNTSTVVTVRGFRPGWLPSDPATAAFTIEPDTTPPEIVSASAHGDPTRVMVTFSEMVEPASSETAANYGIDKDISVLAATLHSEGDRVELLVSELQEDITYTLTVTDVRDRALPPNTIDPGTAVTFTFQRLPLVAHWRMDEGAGDSATDASGNGHNGAVRGATWAAGRTKSALSFDGIDDRVEIDHIDTPGAVLTITAWFKADRFDNLPSHDARIISKATGVEDNAHWWMLSTIAAGNGTRLRFRLKTDGVTSTLIAGSGDLDAGRWIHAAAVYDGTSMVLYKNAREVARTAKTGSIDTEDSVACWIGGNPSGGADRPFDGLIDDVRVYRAALTPDQLQAVMRETAPLMQRGDANSDSCVDIADAVFTLGYLFATRPIPLCLDAADANDDGRADIADAIYVLQYLFASGSPIPEPWQRCGVDPTVDELGCAAYPPCEE